MSLLSVSYSSRKLHNAYVLRRNFIENLMKASSNNVNILLLCLAKLGYTAVSRCKYVSGILSSGVLFEFESEIQFLFLISYINYEVTLQSYIGNKGFLNLSPISKFI